MLFSELTGKVIVNVDNGEVLGHITDADLLVDEVTGRIESLLLPPLKGFSRNLNGDGALVIPWQDVVKIGGEVIIISKEVSPGR